MFSLITNIYNKKTKEPTLMELFTATGKLKKFFFFKLEMFDVCTTGDTAHIDMIFKFLPHTCHHGDVKSCRWHRCKSENMRLNVIIGLNIKNNSLLRSAFFRVITQRVLVISYRRFGTTYLSRLQGSRIQKELMHSNFSL